MPWFKRRPVTIGCLLLLIALTQGCANPSLPGPPQPIAPPVTQPPALPPLPSAVHEPPPPGHYWQMACDFRTSLQQQLKVTLPKFEPCSAGAAH